MRNLFSKGLMAAAAVMMFASCSNEEGVNVPTADGKTTDVTIGLSVAPSTRSTAEEVNLDTDKQPITNIAVVPMVGTAPQKPVRWDAVDANGKSEEKTAQLLSSVNGFRVYGNLTAEQYAATENVLALDGEMFKLQQSKKNTAYKAPHSQLYYYRDVKAGEFFTNSTASSWENVQPQEWTSAQSVGTAKYVKVDGINYAVGILAAAVMNGDNTLCFKTAAGDKNAVEAGVKVTGIIVNNQRDFTKTFTLGDTPYEVYETADNQEFARAGIGASNANEGNIYMIAAPTNEADQVNVNIEFLLPADVTLTKTDGTKVTGAPETGTKLYLGLKLKGQGQATSQKIASVFAADYITYLNATVKNWGIATETPVEVTDAQIGVEFNVDWAEGNIYNVEI